jgi:hypothetical protein
MKHAKKLVYASMLVVGLGIGMISAPDVSAMGPCGNCAIDPGTKLSFCNFAHPGISCGGNNGADCGSVPCS